MSRGSTRGRGIVAAAEVVTPTKDIPGSMSSKVDTGIIERAETMDMVISIAMARSAGADPTRAGTDTKSGMGVCVGVKGTQPTPPILKTDSGRSVETRNITTEVGWDDSRDAGGGGGSLGGNGIVK